MASNKKAQKSKAQKSSKPFIIANPIYDTVFKRLMENQRIAKFFLSTILEQKIEELSVLPQEFTYQLDPTKVQNKGKKKRETSQYYSIFRLDFIATVLTDDGMRRKILIELQKSWDIQDVTRFRQYLGEQYIRVEAIDNEEIALPITTIYILGANLAEIDCPCIKTGRPYINMLDKTIIHKSVKFIELLTHECYVIQAGRITDIRYTTNLDKLLSIFEQRYFVNTNSQTMKEYPYQPDDKNIKLITKVLYEMVADPEKRKEMEIEEKSIRYIERVKKSASEPLKKTIEEQANTIKEKDKALEESKKTLEEKDKALEESKKTIEERDKENAELIEKYTKLERLLRDKQIE